MIDIFVVDTSALNRTWDHSVLSQAETSRAETIVIPSSRERWVRSRIALRQILGDRLSMTPDEVPIEQSCGKPILKTEGTEPRPTFSLTRSDRFACIAISPNGLVGVDIESRRKIKNREAKSARFFCAHENEQLEALATSDRDHEFLTIWTAKEACLKAVGTGVVSFPVTQVCVSIAPTLRYEKTLDQDATSWELYSFSNSNFVGCVARNCAARNCAASNQKDKQYVLHQF